MQMSDLFAVANLASGVKIISRHDIYGTYGEKKYLGHLHYRCVAAAVCKSVDQLRKWIKYR